MPDQSDTLRAVVQDDVVWIPRGTRVATTFGEAVLHDLVAEIVRPWPQRPLSVRVVDPSEIP